MKGGDAGRKSKDLEVTVVVNTVGKVNKLAWLECRMHMWEG